MKKMRTGLVLHLMVALVATPSLALEPGLPDYTSLEAELSDPATANNDNLAQQLANPVAALISVPVQLNFDSGLGPNGEGSRTILNVQPVIPFSISDDWNLISRTIVPFVDVRDVTPEFGSTTGIGDIVQSFFFSPKQPTSGGVIWGIGPVFLLPTASDDAIGTGKWGAGVTGVALTQRGPWSVGGLANHIWSFAGDAGRADVNQTFVQPFASYTTDTAWTFTLTSESTYNWETEQWSVPINGTVSKIVRFGKLPVSLFGGVRYWAESPEFGPKDWGLRFGATILLPRG